MAQNNSPFDEFLYYLQNNGMEGSFQPYGAGRKTYGGGRSAPNVGPVSGDGKTGYKNRDLLRQQALRNKMLKKMQANQQGRLMSPEALRGGRY